jgi:hypothetical protein
MDEKNNIWRGNLKAQFWSFDVIFAIIIFIVALTILGFTWYNINNQLSLGYSGAGTVAQLQAHMVAQNLIGTGSPANWQSIVNTTNSLTWGGVGIGLGTSPGGSNLSISKIYTFMSMASGNYQATKQELGTGYDYYIQIYGPGMNISIGSSPFKNKALSIYVEKRSAFVSGEPVTVQVLLWTSSALAIT